MVLCACGGESTLSRFEPLAQAGPETFVMALAVERDGTLWLGTEEHGLFRLAPDGTTRAFTALGTAGVPSASGPRASLPASSCPEPAASIPDDLVYALRFDRQGRLWAGLLNSGVAVWNGQEWKTYGPGAGPLGERVHTIACNPVDGDIWIGTNAGLTRYSSPNDRWIHLTPADGLPAWDIVSLAFDATGDLYAGTACGGLAIASARQGYQHWRSVRAPASGLWTARGTGLPSDQINQVLVAKNGAVYVATSAGLACSIDKGVTWSFVRGADYVAKAQGLAAGKPADLRPPKDPAATLPEDYVTCLAEDPSGGLWLGFRRKGLALVDPATLQVKARFVKERDGLPDDYVKSLLPLPDGRLAVGTYGGGAALLKDAFPSDRGRSARAGEETSAAAVPKPVSESALGRTLRRTLAQQQSARQEPTGEAVGKSSAPPPDAEPPAGAAFAAPAAPVFPKSGETVRRGRSWGMDWAIRQAEKPRQLDRPFAVALDDDWQTRGDWIGTYGSFYHCLCAVKAPMDWIGGNEAYWVQMSRSIGEHRREFPLRLDEFSPTVQPPKEMAGQPIPDTLRCWIHFMKSDLPWVLQLPDKMGGGRRQAEWDDHAECYPFTWEGPHLYCDLMIGGKKDDPEDLFLLSFYIVNKDGHQGHNRFRDYLLTLKAAGRMPLAKDLPGWEAQWRASPTLAEKRIQDFRGGVYKRFLVRRGMYSIRVDKNDSFNTILSGIFIERVKTEAGAGTAAANALTAEEVERYRRLLLGPIVKGEE